MKPFVTIISFLFSISCYSQIIKVESVRTDSGIHEFKLQAEKDPSDYSKAFRILTNQVKQNPLNAELRYYLGYTIDRLNSEHGAGIINLTKDMTIKASEQFEEVNRLEPVYKGEVFILGPYAKLSSIWGSLAMCYLHKNLVDSAVWAFTEGRKRGGFGEPIVEYNRQLLNSCDKNGILVTYGDNITLPAMYIQAIENYRTDVTIVDANLIHTNWYPKYLIAEKKLDISFSEAEIDSIDYKEWEPRLVTVSNRIDTTQTFSWELRPTYLKKYILKGDRILLNIFEQNFFNRPIYFNNSSDSSFNLFLTPYLADEGLVNRVTTKIVDYNTDEITVPKNLYEYNIDKLTKEDIAKSGDAVFVLNFFRWAYFKNITRLLKNAKYEKAKELMNLMNIRFKKDKLPYTSVEIEEYFSKLFQRVDNF